MSQRYPILAITDGPTVGAHVRADLASDDVWLERSPDFDLGSPDIEGGGVSARPSVRAISLPLVIGGDEAAVTAALRSVGSAVLRPGGWLMYQRGPDADPYWWRIVGAPQGALNRAHVHSDAQDSAWRWPLKLTTDGYAVEAQRTLWSGTLTHNAAGLSVELPECEGDAPAPLTVTLTPSVAWSGSMLLAMTHVDSASTLTEAPVWPSTGWVSPGGTGLTTVADAWAIAGSLKVAGNASGVWFTAPAAVPPGRYRLLVRARTTRPTSAGVQFRAGLRYGGSTLTWGAWQSLPAGTGTVRSWLDFGAFSLPSGVPVTALDGDTMAKPVEFALQLGPSYGSTMADMGSWDTAVLVPEALARGAGASILTADFGSSTPQPTIPLLIDSEQRRMMLTDFVGAVIVGAEPPLIGGQYPSVVPDQRSILTILPGLNATQEVGPSATVGVTVTYRPRRLHPA